MTATNYTPLSQQDVETHVTVPEAARILECPTEVLSARVATYLIPALWGYPMDSEAPVAYLSLPTVRGLAITGVSGDLGPLGKARQVLLEYVSSVPHVSDASAAQKTGAALVARTYQNGELVHRLHVRAEAVQEFADSRDVPFAERWSVVSDVEQVLRLVGASPHRGMTDVSGRRVWGQWWRLPASLAMPVVTP